MQVFWNSKFCFKFKIVSLEHILASCCSWSDDFTLFILRKHPPNKLWLCKLGCLLASSPLKWSSTKELLVWFIVHKASMYAFSLMCKYAAKTLYRHFAYQRTDIKKMCVLKVRSNGIDINNFHYFMKDIPKWNWLFYLKNILLLGSSGGTQWPLVWIGVIALNVVLKSYKPFPPLLLYQQANIDTVR